MSSESSNVITPEEDIENGDVPSPSASAPLLNRDHATAVSALRATVPTDVLDDAISEIVKDCPEATVRVTSLTVTVIVRSVVAESAESVALS